MTTQLHSQESQPVQSLQDYVAMFHRRRTLIVLAGGILLGLSLAVAFLWPATYKSMATILIEEQEIPSELVHSTITSYADQRIETIKQQVMSRTTLWKVVEQYNLYADLRRTNPAEEVVKRFTKDIAVEVISANVVDKRTQQPTKATIAFTSPACAAEGPEKSTGATTWSSVSSISRRAPISAIIFLTAPNLPMVSRASSSQNSPGNCTRLEAWSRARRQSRSAMPSAIAVRSVELR